MQCTKKAQAKMVCVADLAVTSTCNRAYPASHIYSYIGEEGEPLSSTTNANMVGALLQALMGQCIAIIILVKQTPTHSKQARRGEPHYEGDSEEEDEGERGVAQERPLAGALQAVVLQHPLAPIQLDV